MALAEYPQHFYDVSDDSEHFVQLEVRIHASYPAFDEGDLKDAVMTYLTGLSGATASSAQKKVVTVTAL